MAEKSFATNETIRAIEKKMNMTLDDLIKNSKKQNKNSSTEMKKRNTTQRFSNKAQKPFHYPASAGDKSSRLQRFMDSGSSRRQAAFALRRSNFQENPKFSVAVETGKKVTISAPACKRSFNGKRIEKWNKPRDGLPPVQRKTAIVYVVANKWNKQAKVVPKQRYVEATRKKSVWQRLSVGPSRNQFQT